MPSLDGFKEKQKTVEKNRRHTNFQPKRYAPYLLQEEVINSVIKEKQYETDSIYIQQDIHKHFTVYEKEAKLPHSNINSSVNDYIIRLYGIKKTLLFYFAELCNSKGELTTGPVNLSTLMNITGSTSKAMKKIIQNMIKENLIKRIKGKTGKGGFSIFSLTDTIKNAVIEHNSKLNIQTLNKKTNNSTNNVDKYNNVVYELPDEWKEINYKPLQDVGFSESQLKQLYNKKLNTPPLIQASINHFAFGLINNKDKFNKYKDPLNVLMGVLISGGRWIEKNYETPQDQALKCLLEEKQQQKENREKLIAAIIELEFPEWEKNLNEEEKKAIVPEEILNSRIKKGIISTLKLYFRDTILLPRLKGQGKIAI
jgi:predicted transcriptional regulator